MHVIVVGCGEIGSQLARLLAAEGHDVVVVDRDPGAFRALGTSFDGVTVEGVGYDRETLRRAGVDGCESLVAVTGRDTTNIMAAEVAARLFRVPRVVARLGDPSLEGTMQKLGIDHVLGTTLVARELLEKAVRGHAHHFTIRGDLEVVEFMAGPAAAGRRVAELQAPEEFRVCLVTRAGASFIPGGATVLAEGDLLLAVIRTDALPKVAPLMARP